MPEAVYLDFFMGGLSPAGFHGYFDTLGPEEGCALTLVQSGPGCGKSTLLRRLAAQGQGTVERIHCASDPDSLDGVIFWQQNAAVLDATAPHVLEPAYPGVCEQVVSLYHTLDCAGLRAHSREIVQLFQRCAGLQERASRAVASAGSLLLDSRRTAASHTDFAKAERYALRLAASRLPKTDRPPRESVRLLSTLTPQGVTVFRQTVPKLADTLYVFQDEYGAASRAILSCLRQQALARGHWVITCQCAMAPEDKIDHLFLPELRLAFLTSNRWHPMDFAGQRNIRCTRFADGSTLRCRQKRLCFNRKAVAELLAQAASLQRDAHETHNELEKFYSAAVDFAAVEAAGAALATALGLAQ